MSTFGDHELMDDWMDGPVRKIWVVRALSMCAFICGRLCVCVALSGCSCVCAPFVFLDCWLPLLCWFFFFAVQYWWLGVNLQNCETVCKNCIREGVWNVCCYFLCASCSGSGCHRHIVSLSHQFELLLFLFLFLVLLLLLVWSWFCKIDWLLAFAIWIARKGTPQAESVAIEAGCVGFLDHYLISELVYIHCRPRPPQIKVLAWMSTSSKPGTSYILSNSYRGQHFKYNLTVVLSDGVLLRCPG